MRFHLVGLPHTQTTAAFSSCAYTQKVVKFADMMTKRGHTVYLYAGDDNSASCHEHIPCINEEERAKAVGSDFYTSASTDETLPYWKKFNANVVGAIKLRAQPQDFICVSWGKCHKPIADALPHMMTVEYGVGYPGTFSKYRVWESYAWMHYCYGNRAVQRGEYYDAVIPNFFNPEDFPFVIKKLDYFVFMGRLIDDKGAQVAADACRLEGAKLYIAGNGTPPNYGEYLGSIGPHQRGLLMSHAKAVFVPTRYIEPFGGVAVEAQMCGTPVITTDWGAFPETVEQGVTGFRCRTQREFRNAMRDVDTLEPLYIRKRALSLYSTDVVARQYEDYFNRLLTLWGKGWNA